MKKLSNKELLDIAGGATQSYTSASFINAIYKVGNLILELGRSAGTAIRRIYDDNICSL